MQETTTSKGKYEQFRERQVNHLLAKLAPLTGSDPVILTADLNSRPANPLTANLPHKALLNAGFYDAAAATTRTNDHLPTFTGFGTTVATHIKGYGSRIDFIMVKGATGSISYKVHAKKKNADRPSDHALISAHLRLP